MIAFIRARFPDTPTEAVWSDTVATNWMDPTFPFSLAHFWKVSTFQQVDMSYFLFPPVVVNDPRTATGNQQDQLVRAVLEEADRKSKPDWNLFEQCIIFFAQPTPVPMGDVFTRAFGGGTHLAPNGKPIGAAVFDVDRGFLVACHEVGHMFGLDHELGPYWYYDPRYGKRVNEYGCPYSVMSDTSFLSTRAPDPRLPESQRQAAPCPPTVHLYLNQYHAVDPNGVFNHPGTVTHLPATYEQTPATVRLVARDVASAAWPSRRTVLAVVPPIVPGWETHFLELRRKDGLYDAGIPTASVIITAATLSTRSGAAPDLSTLRFRYVDRIDLEGLEGDLDYHSFSGHFVVRVTRTDDDFSAVNLTVTGAGGRESFSLTLDPPVTNRKRFGIIADGKAVVAACPAYEKREYSYEVNTFETFQILQARSSGYEKPHYAWYLENVLLNTASSPVALDVQCREVVGHEVGPPAVHRVTCSFNISGGNLQFNTVGEFADIALTLRVVVGESSPEVMKNYYPDRSLVTTVRADNLVVEWNAEYWADVEACLKKSLQQKLENKVGPPELPGRDDRPKWDEQLVVRDLIRDLIRDLAEREDHRSAYAVAAEVARRAGVPTENVLEDLFGSVGNERGLRR